MRVTITERHGEISPRLRQRIESRVGAVVKYESRATQAEVTCVDEGHTKTIEAVVHIDGSPHVVAKARSDDFRSAFSEMMDRLRRQLKDGRERRRDHQAPPLSEGVDSE